MIGKWLNSIQDVYCLETRKNFFEMPQDSWGKCLVICSFVNRSKLPRAMLSLLWHKYISQINMDGEIIWPQLSSILYYFQYATRVVRPVSSICSLPLKLFNQIYRLSVCQQSFHTRCTVTFSACYQSCFTRHNSFTIQEATKVVLTGRLQHFQYATKVKLPDKL